MCRRYAAISYYTLLFFQLWIQIGIFFLLLCDIVGLGLHVRHRYFLTRLVDSAWHELEPHTSQIINLIKYKSLYIISNQLFINFVCAGYSMAAAYWLNSLGCLSLSLLCLFATTLQVTSGEHIFLFFLLSMLEDAGLYSCKI